MQVFRHSNAEKAKRSIWTTQKKTPRKKQKISAFRTTKPKRSIWVSKPKSKKSIWVSKQTGKPAKRTIWISNNKSGKAEYRTSYAVYLLQGNRGRRVKVARDQREAESWVENKRLQYPYNAYKITPIEKRKGW